MANTTLNQIAYSILDTIRPKATNVEAITIDLIKYHIKNTRALLIRNELNKNRTIDSSIIQDLGCIEMELVDRSECCSIDIGCKFLRSKLPIPSRIELHARELITRVGPVDKTARPYDIIPYQRVPFEGGNKYTKNLIKAFFMDDEGYLYILVTKENNAKFLDTINVQGVFENPEEVAKFKTCSGDPCYSDDDRYPLKAWMIPAIQTMIIEKFVGREAAVPIDTSNDNKVNPSQQIER